MPEESSHNPSEAVARPACSTCLQGATGGEAETRGGKKKRGGRKGKAKARSRASCPAGKWYS